jgi:hypothetical protein
MSYFNLSLTGYLIRCKTVSRMDLSQVVAVCEAPLHDYGMPRRIRTDDGEPSLLVRLPSPIGINRTWFPGCDVKDDVPMKLDRYYEVQ